MILIMLIGAFVLLFFGVPIALALAIPSLVYIMFDPSVPDIATIQRLVAGVNVYTLLAVPYFIFAGNLMNTSGITDRIFNFANCLIGGMKGGLAHVNVVSSVIFAGMSGTAIADAGGVGAIEMKAMRDAGYDDRLTIGITAASSAIGPIIPPSLVMVVYAVVSSTSIGRLFAAGIVPGVAMALSLMLMIFLMSSKYKMPVQTRASLNQIISGFKKSIFALMTPAIILGGMFSGVFTATEAAAVASLYAVILGTLIYKEMDFKTFYKATLQSAKLTVQVMFIVASATLFGWILAKEEVPNRLAALILGNTDSYYLVLFSINAFLLVVGLFMEAVAAINILIPVFMPIAIKIGIDPVQFGVIVCLNLTIGMLTPPFGTVLFVLSKVAGTPVEKIAKDTLPFVIPLLVVLGLITVLPVLTLFLPNIIFGK